MTDIIHEKNKKNKKYCILLSLDIERHPTVYLCLYDRISHSP